MVVEFAVDDGVDVTVLVGGVEGLVPLWAEVDYG